MMRARRQRDPAATRRVLLETAASEFARHGYQGCRTQSVADAAGVNKAMISYHFGGKLGLYRAVVTDRMAGLSPRLQAVRERREPAADKWRYYVSTIFNIFAEDPLLYRIILREHLDGGERLQKEFAREMGEFFRTTRTVLEQGRREGAIGSVDPHSIHLSLIGAITFYLASIPYREKAAGAGHLIAPSPGRGAYRSHLVRLFSGLFGTTSEPQEELP